MSEKSSNKDTNLRTLELTTREVDLLLEYGYPFSATEAALKESKAVDGLHRVRIDVFWIEHMLGDLAYSEREIRNRQLLEELDELYSVLESALNVRDDEKWE